MKKYIVIDGKLKEAGELFNPQVNGELVRIRADLVKDILERLSSIVEDYFEVVWIQPDRKEAIGTSSCILGIMQGVDVGINSSKPKSQKSQRALKQILKLLEKEEFIEIIYLFMALRKM
jgi:hypothetical protein